MKSSFVARLVLAAAVILTAGCFPPVAFFRTYIDYGLRRDMKPAGKGVWTAEATGQRCYYQNQSSIVHAFTLNDQVADSAHFDPPNRIVVDITDEAGIRPGHVYNFTLSLKQNGVEVEHFSFKMDNSAGSGLRKNWRYSILVGADVNRPNEEGQFAKADRFIGGSYVLSTSEASGRDMTATIYFPVTNSAKVSSVCAELN